MELRNKGAGAETTLVNMPRGQGTTRLHTDPSPGSDSGNRLGRPFLQMQDRDSPSALSSLKHAVRELHSREKLAAPHRVFACPPFLFKKCGQRQCLCSPFQPPLCHGFVSWHILAKGIARHSQALLNAMRAKYIMLRLSPAHGERGRGGEESRGRRDRERGTC